MRSLGKRARISRKGDRGQASVEFLFTILFLILFIVGILEVILMVYTYNVLADSAKEGVRYAIVHGCDLGASSCSGSCGTACSDTTFANVKTQVTNWAKLSFHDISGMTVNVSYGPPDSTSDAPNRVRVTVSYPFKPLFGLGWPSITVNAAAEGRIVF